MKKLTFLLFLTFFYFNSSAQYKQTVTTNLVGIQSKEDFEQMPFSQWFDLNYNNYNPDKSVVKEIKKYLNNVSIKAFMGTWCSDSKLEVPNFYKLFDALHFDYKDLTMIAVSRDKTTPDNLQEGLNISRVPTFVFYKNGKEIGRFVEYPRETLEKDILKIVSGKPYKHSYEND